jgi:hypothetical protein
MEEFIKDMVKNLIDYDLNESLEISHNLGTSKENEIKCVNVSGVFNENGIDMETMTQIMGACTDFYEKYDIDYTLVKIQFIPQVESNKIKFCATYPISAIKKKR